MDTKSGCWVGICGELGADTTLTETFVKMGVDELSVTPASVLPIRKIIRETVADVANGDVHFLTKVYVPICKSGCPLLRIRVSPSALPGLFFLGIWELILHHLVVEVGVYNMLPAAGCGRTAVPFAVAYQCGGGDQHIYGHKQNQNPCQDITGDFWDFFQSTGRRADTVL